MAALVSIIIPTYNRTRWLAQAIESAINQTYQELEIIVVDDGSPSQDTHDLVCRYPGVQYLYQTNKGLGAARNTGLKKSHGQYIQFLDDDDELFPNAIAEKIRIFECDPVTGVVYSDLELTDEDGKYLEKHYQKMQRPLPSGDIFEIMINRNFITPHALLWRRDVLERTHGFPERPGHEDWECLVRASEFASFDYVDQPLGLYRQHPSSMSHSFDIMYAGKNPVNQFIVSSPRFSRVPKRRQAFLLSKYALQQFSYGDPKIALGYLAQARREDPSLPLPYMIGILTWLGRPFARWLIRLNWAYHQAQRPSSGKAKR